MHLMYTLDENGNRVYTLKVPAKSPFLFLRSSPFCVESDDRGEGNKICASRSAQSTPFFAFPDLKDILLIPRSPILPG